MNLNYSILSERQTNKIYLLCLLLFRYGQNSYEPMSEVLGRPGTAHYRNEGIKTHQSVCTHYDLGQQGAVVIISVVGLTTTYAISAYHH